MKIKLLGKDLTQIRLLLSKYGLVEAESGFDLIIAHGGDGTLLGAERDYPGVLKLPIRDKSCCPEHTPEQQIKKLVDGVLKEQHLQKVAARYQNTQLSALNDVFLHMSDPASALRYRVYIDDELYADEVVGDGICFCSVHGSSAYYRSITHSIFRTGVGLAFSNSTEAVDHLVLDCDTRVKVTILRGPGILFPDNSPVRLTVSEGETVEFFQSGDVARIMGLNDFMCECCRMLRHPHKMPLKTLLSNC